MEHPVCETVLVLYMFIRSKRVRQEAGELLVPSVRLCLWEPSKPRKWLIVAGIVFYGLWLVTSLLAGRIMVPAVFLLGWVLIGMPVLLWIQARTGPAYLELRERGLIFGGYGLTPWPLLKSYRWMGERPVHLKLYLRHAIADLPLRAEDRPVVERILAEQVADVD